MEPTTHAAITAVFAVIGFLSVVLGIIFGIKFVVDWCYITRMRIEASENTILRNYANSQRQFDRFAQEIDKLRKQQADAGKEE